MILDMIINNRKKQLKEQIEKLPLTSITEMAFEHHRKFKTVDLYSALKGKGLSIIAEVKRASPEKGVIRDDFEPVSIAKKYKCSGAAAISVLTEEHFYKGSGEHLIKMNY